MDEIFYTRIRKDEFVIYQVPAEIDIKLILNYLKEQNLKGKCQIEYSMLHKNEHYVYGIYIIRNFKIFGAIYPYAYCQNSKKKP